MAIPHYNTAERGRRQNLNSYRLLFTGVRENVVLYLFDVNGFIQSRFTEPGLNEKLQWMSLTVTKSK